LRTMDEQGGWLKTVEEGHIQVQLYEQARTKANSLLDGSRPWLGVNLYASEEGPALKNIAWTSPESTHLKALHFPIFQVA
ncbi:MAG: methylmalonyl-CoA mutase family protein, partial [Bacteroidetes bacterium]|nr:methylmalonyl-CoA mutase family protein [Bacteroidota bacterium]